MPNQDETVAPIILKDVNNTAAFLRADRHFKVCTAHRLVLSEYTETYMTDIAGAV